MGKQCSKTHVMVGLAQFMTAPYIIGWIWSIYWGFLIFMNQPKHEMVAPAPQMNAEPYNPNPQYDMSQVNHPNDQYNNYISNQNSLIKYYSKYYANYYLLTI